MHSITAALENLQGFLAEPMPEVPGTRVFAVTFPLNDAFDPLSWLCGQAHFPQFYWQHRNGHEEVAALGAVRHFTSLAEANLFVQQHDELRIWGLNAFTPERGALFLPRLEWRRDAGKASLRLTLHSENSLREEAERAQAFLTRLAPSHPLPALTAEFTGERHYPDKAGWVRMIEEATQTIATGELDKVALARATDLRFATPLNAGAMMAASRRVNHYCYHFLMRFDDHSAFLGSSPERLWLRQENQLQTEALAGTVVNHPDDKQAGHFAEWLMQDDKNQRENLLVVEDICQRLQQDVDSLEVLPPEVVRLRKVQHLRRCIQAELKKPDDARCQSQLQPTAAVAGLPREAARQFIDHHEPFTREWYAGSAGYLGKQQSEFCVTLRSAKVAGEVVRLYAGAGIVRGSDPDQEWQEITQKAAGLRSLLLSD